MPRGVTGPLRLLIAAMLAAAAHAAAAQLPDGGFLLVAKPSIQDPNFAHTVVLVALVPDGATLGVILNRPTKRSLADILPGDERLARFTEPLCIGGPVQATGLFALFRGTEAPGESFPMIGDVRFAIHPATVEQLLRNPPEALRLFAGYAGWGPGQLDGELARGDWWTLQADVETIFRKDTGTLWEELSRRLGSVTALRDGPSRREDAKKRENLQAGSLRTSAPFASLR
jgi:putative transcriptional regulator